ncbi:MAG: 16S rRNA (cytosine(967)-C(5))-methyltransferase RsmB [Cyanobacteria bacterium NC_groundwater_1444_Ag_S-0.65um_54_12]|nr:16S rRNA (cytosine(967)-C(5))-methyltransferase RsmB [Cyanobacteria bacterium NC_groundwater_1444_Ag_S-0.65um_54_12]
MVSPAREWALQLLLDIELGGSFANLALNKLPVSLSERDRRLVTELVNGTTRMRRTLDSVLDQVLTKPGRTLKPTVRNILRLGAYQLLFLQRIPARAAIFEAVAAARRCDHGGAAKLTNAVLRRISGLSLDDFNWSSNPIQRIGERWSYPDWIIEVWAREYDLATAQALAEAQNRPPPFSLRTNVRKLSRETLIEHLAAAGVRAQPSIVAPEGISLAAFPAVSRLPGYRDGWWYVQGESAMLASRVVAPQAGEVIADIGAGPGGKATHLAELMGDAGRVLAIEPNGSRLALVKENARRLGILSIQLLQQPGQANLPSLVDRALVDAPCSGLGTLYRKADSRWRSLPTQLAELADLQLQLLEAIATCIKPGGILVYTTCTISRKENQEVVNTFLARQPQFRTSDLQFALPAQWQHDTADGMMQILPSRHGTEGFFIARFRKATVST